MDDHATQETGKERAADGRALLWFGWLAFLASVVALLATTDLRLWFNADFCYAPMLVRDIASLGGRLSEWDLPPAPYFFPDVAVCAAWYMVFRNPSLALTASGVTFLALFVLGWSVLARRGAGTPERGRFGQAAVLLAGAVLCTVESFRQAAVSAMMIAGHFGATVAAPYMLLLACGIVEAPPGRKRGAWRMVLLAGLAALLAVSDMLAVVQVCLPVAAAAVTLTFRNDAVRSRGWLIAGLLASGALLGVAALGLLDRTASLSYLQISFSRLGTSIATGLAADWVRQCLRESPASVLLPAAAGCWLAMLAVRDLWRTFLGSPVPLRSAMVPAFAVAVLASTAVAVAFAGRWMAGYMSPVTLGLVFAAVAAATRLPPVQPRFEAASRAVLALGFAAAILFNGWHLAGARGLDRYSDGGTGSVRAVAIEAGRLGLTCGVTDYWTAKPIALFSQTGIAMLQSTPDLMPYQWICNREWFDRLEPQFICCAANEPAPDRIRESDVVAKFGEPLERHAAGDMVILVYSWPRRVGQAGGAATSRFSGWWRNHQMRVRFGKVGDRAVHAVAEATGGKDITYSAPEWPMGSAAFYMTRNLPGGDYAVRVSYDAVPEEGISSPGAWLAMRVCKDSAEAIGGGMLRFGTNTVEGRFEVRKDSVVDFRVLYSGGGVLTVRRFELERVTRQPRPRRGGG